MKRYPTYKDSGVKWIGEIPSHWEVAKLKNQLRLINDKCIPAGMQYIGLENIESFTGKYICSDIKAEGTANRFEKGDVLIGKLRPYLAKAYKCETNGCCSTELLVYRSKDHPDFYKYVFLAKPFVDLIDSSTYGSKMPRANANFIGSQFLPIPPLSEQRAIVSLLDSELGKIDTYVEKEKQLIERLKELKQSVIARAVTRGINPDAKMKPSGISWIGEIPQHWKVKRLSSFFTENSDINTNLKYTEAYKFNYGSLIRKDEGIDIKDLEDTYKKYTILKDNDIVINGLNLNYDFVSQRVAQAYNKGIITSAYLVLTPRKGVNYSYYCYLFKAMDNMKLFHGMGTGIRLTLSFRDLKPQSLPVPPTAEQQKIVDYITAATTKIDRLIVEKTYEIEHIKELRQRLIADAVTGKIDVREPLNKKGAAAATDRE